MKNSEPKIVFFESVSEMLGKQGVEEKDFNTRCELMAALTEYIEQSKMTQKEVAQILKVDQPRVSDLVRGKISKFSLGTLIEYLWRLNFDVAIKFKAPDIKKAEPRPAKKDEVRHPVKTSRKPTTKAKQLEFA